MLLNGCDEIVDDVCWACWLLKLPDIIDGNIVFNDGVMVVAASEIELNRDGDIAPPISCWAAAFCVEVAAATISTLFWRTGVLTEIDPGDMLPALIP